VEIETLDARISVMFPSLINSIATSRPQCFAGDADHQAQIRLHDRVLD